METAWPFFRTRLRQESRARSESVRLLEGRLLNILERDLQEKSDFRLFLRFLMLAFRPLSLQIFEILEILDRHFFFVFFFSRERFS